MKQTRNKNATDLANALGLSEDQGSLSQLKAKLTKEIILTIQEQEVTHQEVADLSGVPRSAITGIVNGSLQKVTLDRLVRIIGALGKKIELSIAS